MKPLSYLTVGSLAFFSLLTSSCVTQGDHFALVSAVPDDFYMVVGSNNTPEQAFLQENWQGVYDAFEETEIMQDVMSLMPVQPGPAVTAQMESVMGKVSDILANMGEGSLGKVSIFAQRLDLPEFSAGGQVNVGPPDMIWLMSVDPEHEEARFGDLLGLMDYGFEELEPMIGMRMSLTEAPTAGIDFRVFNGVQFGMAASDFELALGHHDGALVVTCGPGVREAVADLLVGNRTDSIAKLDRYQQAFEGLHAPESGFSYVDLQSIATNMTEMRDEMQGLVRAGLGLNSPGADPETQMFYDLGLYGANLGIEALSINDYTASVSYLEGRSVHVESVTALVANASDNAFYPMVTSSKPVTNFAQYLPESTTSYSVSGGTDMNQLYDSVLGMVEGAGPMGAMILGQWDQMQQQTGFDIHRDVLDWIDGESINATFTVDGVESWVNRVKVKDVETAEAMVGMAMAMIPELMAMANEANPMAGMLGLTVSASTDPRMEGFSTVAMGMAQMEMLMGVDGDWIVMGSSPDAIELTRATARGEVPNVLANKALVGSAILPEGPVNSVTFSDLSGRADAMADGIETMGMFGGMAGMMIPDPEVADMLGQVLEMVGKMAPVMRAMDFYDSSSSVESFDGQFIRSHSVTNYVTD